MSAGILNLTADQGATFSQTLTWKINKNAVNLTGYSARMKVRAGKTTNPVVSLTSSASGGITLGGSAGTIAILISATSMKSVPSGKYYYDLELESSSGVVTRLVKGTFTVTPEMTY
jgi:hypothetical protein